MVESDLSAEVNATTVLPAPGAPSATIDTSVDVVVKWANNDDSSDGGIDVERSTKGDGYLSSAEARYKFETPTDGTIEDAVGANDGTPFGGTSATGELSTAIGLDGVDDYVELPLASFLEGRTSVTLAGWIYDDSSSITPFARFWSSGNNEFELFRDGSSNTDWNARVNTKNNRRRDIPVTIGSPDQFHHVALTYDGSVARVYVDGTEAVSEPFSGGLQSIGGEVYLGANKSPRDAGYLNGRIDDFRVWGSVLSGDQIQTLADNPNTKFGFSSFTSVTTSLPPSATSFTDTTVSSDERYEYRIERNTDHATSTSGSAAVSLPYFRTATVTAGAAVTADRTTVRSRIPITSGNGSVTANRETVKSRALTLTGDGIATFTRFLAKPRTITTRGDGDVRSRAEFTEVFPEEQTNNLSWDFSFDDPFGFVSEWITETEDINETEAFTVVVDSNVARSYRLGVEYDVDGDGEAEHRTEPQHVTRDGQTLVFPSVGDPGQYRLYIQQMRPDDYLRELTVGLTRY